MIFFAPCFRRLWYHLLCRTVMHSRWWKQGNYFKKHHYKQGKNVCWWRGVGLDDYLLLNCGILCINGSELWPPIRAVEREATVLLEPGRPWKKNQYSSVKMSRQPAILPLSVKYLPPSQDLGLKSHKFRLLPHAPLLLLWNILTGLKSRWFV